MKKIYALLVLMVLVCTTLVAQPVNGTTTFFTNTTTALVANTSCSITKTVNVSGWLLSVSSTSNCGFNWTSTTGGDGRVQYLVGFGTLTQATFGSDDGSQFAMNNMIIGVSTSSWTNKPMTAVGYKNGMAVPGATLNFTSPAATGILNTVVITYTGNAAFNDVDEIIMAPNSTTCNSIFFLEEITISTATPACTSSTVSLAGSTNVLCNGGSTGSATVSVSGGSGFTYTWSPSGGNAASATGLSAGIYTCAVTNSCGAISSRTVQITQPSALVTSTAITNVACNGGNTGVGSITASGGAGAYTYSWSSGATTSAITGLMAGVYTATVTDANNCKSNKSLNITQPTALVTTTALTTVACNGGSNGVGSISVSGGAGGYSYLWSNGANTSVITGLMAGVYTATVTDANNCKSSKSVNITQPTALVTTTALTTVACNGGSTGSATITASGGAAGYTYLWSNGAATAAISSLMAGVYTATVTDANSCSSIKSVNITQPPALVTTTALTNVTCNGASTGSATITVSGGTGAYTYLWSSGAITSFISGVMAGVYTATVTDANGCKSTKPVNITQPTALVTTTALTNVACNGGSTGSATITASGGAGAYTYLWSNGATTSFISNVMAGAYTATVTDANSCNSTKAVTVTQPSALLTSTAVTNAACNGSAGSATITVSGGTGAYTYLWSSGATTSFIGGVMAGVYTATVADANGCTNVDVITVAQPPALVTTTALTNVACNGGSTGSATITASGGTGAYTYLWSDGATTSFISGVMAGVYTATVTDANGCTNINVITVAQPPALVTTTALTNVACNGGSTGSATITASGGTGAYTYLWGNGATNSVINGVVTGVYTATITDANSCTNVMSITISEPAVLTTSILVTNILCNGGSTGNAIISASGGTGPYTYLWSNGATTPIITGITAGVYTATLTDANSCTSTISAIVTEPSVIVTSTSVINAMCNGGMGSATITASGGTGSYLYSWSSGATASVITGAAAGVYTVTVADANGCTIIESITIAEPSALAASLSVIDVTCNGDSNGSATLTVSGGTGTYTYLWSGGATTSVIAGVVAGVYTATVTDANNCSSAYSVMISQPAALDVTVTTSAANICAGDQATLTAIAAGGTGIISYSWTSGPASNVYIVSPALANSYTIAVTDVNLCVKTQTYSFNVAPLPTVSVSDYTICSGNSATIVPTGADTYTITGGSFTVSPLTDTNYSITGTSLAGCLSATFAVVSVSVAPLPTVAVINASICSGETYTFIPIGNAITYSLNGSSTLTVSPLVTTSYTVEGTGANGCNLMSGIAITLSVNPNPTLSINSATICSGETVTLVPAGAAGGSYSITGGSYTVSPNVTTSYTLTGTSNYFCPATNSAVAIVSVNVTPTISVNNPSICSGQTATLIPSGATGGTYTITGGSFTVVPLTTDSYTITGTGAGDCPASNTIVALITVNPLPTVTVISGEICTGETFTISATGADTYSVDAVGNISSVSPTVTTDYSVTGTSLAGCVSATPAILTVSVNPLPVITATASESAICADSGASVTLAGGTADTYTWSTGDNTATVSVNPSVTTTYVLQGTSNKGCINSATVEITVDPCTGIASQWSRTAALVSVYPNPNNGEFVIEATERAELTIMTATGELILSQLIMPGGTYLSMREMANGIYFIKARAGGKQTNIKVIKQ